MLTPGTCMTDRALGNEIKRNLSRRSCAQTLECSTIRPVYESYLRRPTHLHTTSTTHHNDSLTDMPRRRVPPIHATQMRPPSSPIGDHHHGAPISQNNSVIVIDEHEEYGGDDDNSREDNENDSDEDDAPEFLREASGEDSQSNAQLPPNCMAVQPVRCEAGSLRCGSRVELVDGHFLQVVVIYRDLSTGGVYLKGNLMRRNTRTEGRLDKKRNELHYVLQTTSKNPNPRLHHCLVTKTLDDVLRTREIIITNQALPHFSFREDPEECCMSKREQEDHAKLVCRLKHVDELDPSGKKVIGGSFMTVSEGECDPGKCVSRQQLLRGFLGKDRIRLIQTHGARVQADEENFQDFMTASPAHLAKTKRTHNDMTGQDVVDLTEDSDEYTEVVRSKIRKTIERLSIGSDSVIETKTKTKTKTKTIATTQTRTNQSIKDNFAASKVISGHTHSSRRARFSGHTLPTPQQPRPRLAQYTYADICAGAGGTASGAQQAGLKVQFLLDKWDIACDTLKMNFPRAEVLLKDIHSFCTSQRHWSWEQVDILHISYPCQAHSFLNRHDRDGGNNPENIAAGFATCELTQRCKPRIVTFEQTSHIIKKNGDLFHKLLNDITAAGYDLRWRICNLALYRNSQPRKRLIIIAACPGETLPTFPEEVNGTGPDKEQLVTVRRVLRALEPYKARMPPTMRLFLERNKPGYDANKPLRCCITGSGGESNLHPCGKRTFELCELAALQAFLATHRFAGGKTDILKQIGNAVPSCFGKILFEHITKSLRESDRKIALWNSEDDIITLD